MKYGYEAKTIENQAATLQQIQ